MNKTNTTPTIVTSNPSDGSLLTDVSINNMLVNMHQVEKTLGIMKTIRDENLTLLAESKLLQDCIYDLMMGYAPAAMGADKKNVLETISNSRPKTTLPDGRNVSAYEYYLSNVKLEALQTNFIQQFDNYSNKIAAEKNALAAEIEKRDVLIQRLEKELEARDALSFSTPTKLPDIKTPGDVALTRSDIGTVTPSVTTSLTRNDVGPQPVDSPMVNPNDTTTNSIKPGAFLPLGGITSAGTSPSSSLLGSIFGEPNTRTDVSQTSPYKGIGRTDINNTTSADLVSAAVNTRAAVPTPAQFDKKALEGQSYTVNDAGLAVFEPTNPDDILKLCTSSDISKISEDQKKKTLKANGIIIKGFNS